MYALGNSSSPIKVFEKCNSLGKLTHTNGYKSSIIMLIG